jgi:endonuclease/exonuclease/phosphatase family metal-dependent hydrolase
LRRKEYTVIHRNDLCSIGTAFAVACAAPALAQPVGLRLLTHNVRGLEDHSCEQRGHAFGDIVAHSDPPFDVVGLQEYYTNPIYACDADFLSEAIWCTGRYTHGDQYNRFNPPSNIGRDGGIGIFTMGSICDFEVYVWDYQDTPEALQGIILARVQVPNSTVTLDVYVVHLHAGVDDCDRCCRFGELQELRNFIAANSPRSGNPVIVMGDFNIGGLPSCCGNEGYEDIMNWLGSPHDMWWRDHRCGTPVPERCDIHACGSDDSACNPSQCAGWLPLPPINYARDSDPFDCGGVTLTGSPPAFSCAGSDTAWAGYTDDRCRNELTDDLGRIDYIFLITDPALTSSAFDVIVLDSRVVNWTADIIPPSPFEPFEGHVSDHLGVEATIAVLGPPTVWTDAAAAPPGNGTSCRPFTTVAAGAAATPAGGRLLVRAGNYPERITFNRPMSIGSLAGLTRIGP